MQKYEIVLLLIGLTPVIAIAIAGLLIGAATFLKLFTPEDISQLVLLFGGLWLFAMLLLLVITNVCGAIRPRELFADGDGSATAADPYQALIRDITLAETDVCMLMTRADQFVISSVGSPGKDTKTAAASAIDAARAPTGGLITSCPSTWPKDLTDKDAVLGEAANRLSRMESTLKNYTDPELTKTYKQVVPCESFATATADAEAEAAEEQRRTQLEQLRERLAAINEIVTAQKKNLLRPIDNKQKELRSGKPSSCDKAKGSKAMSANVTMLK